jgi:Domain of unknown function (DUF4386)
MFKRGAHTTAVTTSMSSPNGSTSPALDRPGQAQTRRRARLAGIFFVLTFISIAALPLYHSVLSDHNFIARAGGDAHVQLGALAEIITAIAGIGTAVTLYPILRRQSEGLALGYVTLRVVESTIITIGIVSLLAVLTLRQDLAGGATDHASLILTGRSLVAVHDATFLLGPAFCAAIGNGLILGYLMLRSGLVPRRFALFGVTAGSLALLTALLVLFGVYDQVSGTSAVLTFPEAVWELSLGIYLIVKGFGSDVILFAREQRDARADDRTFAVRQTIAPHGAAVAGV